MPVRLILSCNRFLLTRLYSTLPTKHHFPKRTMASIVDAARRTVAENFGGVAHDEASNENEKFSQEDVPDLTGKIGVVTGGSEGIGYATVYALLAHNISQVHIVSPSKEKADEAIQTLRSDAGETQAEKVVWHQADLSDWRTVQRVGREIASQCSRLDILVNNGARGIMTYQVAETTGLDRHMSVNHFGHVVLTSTLLPLLKKTADEGNKVRISNQASNAHQAAPSDVKFASKDELNQDLGPNGQYGRSKLAAILYSRYLDLHLTRMSHPHILINATHPGFVDTEMSTRDIHEPFPIAGYAMSTVMKPLKKDIWEGSASTLFAATKTNRSGTYICPPAKVEAGTPQSRDIELGEQLMKLTDQVLCEYFGVDKWENY